LSVKKNTRSGLKAVKDGVDPVALGALVGQVRDLLKFHLLLGIHSYPAKEGLRSLFVKKSPALPEAAPRSSGTAISPVPTPSLAAVRQQITQCSRCALAEKRFGQVIGGGAERPLLMVVGDWSRQRGRSFSGDVFFGEKEDGMLRRMMQAIGLSADRVYISNAVKCCPLDESLDNACIRKCFVHLNREITALRPVLFLAMGGVAAAALTGKSGPLVRLRGRFYPYRYSDGARAGVMPTFHPNFLLENPEMKKMVWQDLQMVQRQLKSIRGPGHAGEKTG